MFWMVDLRSASLKTMFGDLPPNSKVTFFKVSAEDFMMALPVAVDPVKAIFLIFGWPVMALPTILPNPETIFKTPSGIPASLTYLETYKADKGVDSAVFKTIVFPAAKAGPTFQAHINKGKFHGMI
ncbi:hypothetical protein WICPIJ_006315 [Wickerhamomyces pijperi]|uniref:Uncharacterized protein n=1 Tax=Wickerhamomyces pijperi TaxID=599730 RepID=A0A9P8Q4M6_WICPI|nr:hypothetical protein WICPIJ_006315 [Wickerhamomyces pijperi]